MAKLIVNHYKSGAILNSVKEQDKEYLEEYCIDLSRRCYDYLQMETEEGVITIPQNILKDCIFIVQGE